MATPTDPELTALQALRRATSDYLSALAVALEELDDAMLARLGPEAAYLRSQVAVACGARSNAGYSFGTPAAINRMLERVLPKEEQQ